jgi:GTP pyrophosphokinase
LSTQVADISDTEQVLDYILGVAPEKWSSDDRDLIRRAYEFAREAHEGQRRASGEPYITHCIEVARILADLRLDAETVAAALLHDSVEDCRVTRDLLAERFSNTIANLVEGVTKISSLHFGSRREEQVENLRKMILAMARDIRVVIIKLADRLHNMRTLRHLPHDKQIKISRDTMMVYAPLANRLGMTRIKSELEDAAMYYLHPAEYRMIADGIAMKKAERDAIVQRAIEMLQAELASHKIKAEVRGRSKHLYSIYLKMQKQALPFEAIHDLIGLRVICDDVPTCYDVLGIVHNLWRPIHGRFKDYIALPKENMYQSLHTTVVGPGGEKIEVQVRTYEMHKFAEEGIAAHWKYKEGKTGRTGIEEKLVWLRQLTEWLNEVRDPGEFMHALQKDVFSDTVFVFTPQGDVIELPAGATALDFAYYIHSKLGESCCGAKVNDRLVQIRHVLHNGDFVEILTSKSAHPTADWLEIAKTSRARTRIRHWLKTKNYAENVERGRESIARCLRARGLPIVWEDVEARLKPFLKSYKVASFEDLLGEIGYGGLLAQHVVARAYPEPETAHRVQPRKGSRISRRRATTGVIVDGIANAMVRFAGCCAPVPGDAIVGFVTIGRGVAIHTSDCPSLKNALAQNGSESRLVPAEWDSQNLPVRRVTIRLECTDREGLLADVTSVMKAQNIFIHESSTKSRGETATLRFIIEVKSTGQRDHLFSLLRQVKGVREIGRISRTEIA